MTPHRLHLCPLVNCTELHHEEAAMAPSDPRVTEGLDMCLLDSITLVRIDGCTLPIKDLPTAATPPSIFNETVGPMNLKRVARKGPGARDDVDVPADKVCCAVL